MAFAIIGILALAIGLAARFLKRRSAILWTLSSLIVLTVGQVPLRVLAYMGDSTVHSDPDMQVGVSILVYAILFGLMMLIVVGTRKLPPA